MRITALLCKPPTRQGKGPQREQSENPRFHAYAPLVFAYRFGGEEQRVTTLKPWVSPWPEWRSLHGARLRLGQRSIHLQLWLAMLKAAEFRLNPSVVERWCCAATHSEMQRRSFLSARAKFQFLLGTACWTK